MEWWFVDYILLVTVIVYSSVKGSIVTTTTWKRYSPFTTFCSVLGLILLIYGISVNDWEEAMGGAFLFLIFIAPLIHRKQVKLTIYHRLCVLALGVLGYYTFRQSLLTLLLLIIGVAGLIDTIYLIIRRKL
ncbi:MAG: hypothetical protein ACE5R6_12870 [Candidatus Heimdallarchaeota archaeon]